MRAKLTQASEDYLKVIYQMTCDGARASTNGIAKRMGVTPASATGMIQKLADFRPPLADYEKHRGVILTAEGEQAALEIIRHHRLLETFLLEKLGYTWDEVHDEADRMEHVISEAFEDRISKALGEPAFDPHGEPIPSREFVMPEQSKISLSELAPGDQAIVVRIDAGDITLLRHLASIHLNIGSSITVLDRSPFDGNLQVQLGGQESQRTLGPQITSKIFVDYNLPTINPRANKTL
jgi:DtxR family transcriptional regulator, Mn-dependent transcriptional regulator